MNELLLTAEILSALEATGISIGDGEQPAGAGWTGTPRQSTFEPYAVLHPLLGGSLDGSIDAPHDMAVPLYQVSCYGGSRAQCQWVVDQVTPVMLALRPTIEGEKVIHATCDMLGGARRDDTSQPPLWQSVPRFRYWTAPTVAEVS